MRAPGPPYEFLPASLQRMRMLEATRKAPPRLADGDGPGVTDPAALKEMQRDAMRGGRPLYVPPLPDPSTARRKVMDPMTMKDQLSGRPSVGTPGSSVPPTGHNRGQLMLPRPTAVGFGGDAHSPRRLR